MRKNTRILTLVFLVAFVTLLVGCLTEPNQRPIITSDPVKTAKVGVAYTYDVEATDPDEDTLTYFLTKKPSGMFINSATGLIKWTPIPVQIGDNSVIITVSDGSLNITQSFTIAVSADEHELVLVGIEVDPKIMELYAGEIKEITSVTATYEVKGYETDIVLEKCLFLSSDLDVATVSSGGLVEAVGEGTANILVSYEGKFDTLEVTVEKAVTITWFEDAIRYNPDGTESGASWVNDELGPAVLVEDDGGWCFADVDEAYNASGYYTDFSGVVAISETGVFSGCTTYTYPPATPLLTEDNFLGQVEIIVYEDGTSGTMVGTYTQWSYKFGTETDVKAQYPLAVECVEDEGKWFVGHTDYITYPR